MSYLKEVTTSNLGDKRYYCIPYHAMMYYAILLQRSSHESTSDTHAPVPSFPRFFNFSCEMDDVGEKRMYSHDTRTSPAQADDHHTSSLSGTL